MVFKHEWVVICCPFFFKSYVFPLEIDYRFVMLNLEVYDVEFECGILCLTCLISWFGVKGFKLIISNFQEWGV